MIGKSAYGLHFGGISNMVNGDLLGAQFGGIANTVNGNVTGLQMAGISNVATGHIKGAQMGLINTARSVSGLQFGLINVAEDFEKGVPIGLFSFVKNGFHAIEFQGGESIYARASLKLGVEKFYTIYNVGMTSANSESYLTYGMGIGSMVSLTEKTKIAIDLTSNHIVESTFSPRLNLLNRADASFRYHFGDHLAVFGGPSFNVYVTEHLAEANQVLNIPYTIYNQNWWNDNGSTSIWLGANAGVSVMF